jgi:hypothetical protein
MGWQASNIIQVPKRDLLRASALFVSVGKLEPCGTTIKPTIAGPAQETIRANGNRKIRMGIHGSTTS